jgi:hypothetical protein
MIEPPFILHGSSSQHCGSALEMAKAELGSAPAELAGIHRQSSRCQGSPPPPQLCAYACRLSLVLRSTCVRQGCKGWLEFRVRCPTLSLTSLIGSATQPPCTRRVEQQSADTGMHNSTQACTSYLYVEPGFSHTSCKSIRAVANTAILIVAISLPVERRCILPCPDTSSISAH